DGGAPAQRPGGVVALPRRGRRRAGDEGEVTAGRAGPCRDGRFIPLLAVDSAGVPGLVGEEYTPHERRTRSRGRGPAAGRLRGGRDGRRRRWPPGTSPAERAA